MSEALLLRRRAMMQVHKQQGGFDMIIGTVTSDNNTITMPIPEGYYCHLYISELGSGREFVEGDLRVWYREKYGLYRVKSANGGAERQSTNPFVSTYYVTQTATTLSITGTNKNTSGLIVNGDTWTYVAWKALE